MKALTSTKLKKVESQSAKLTEHYEQQIFKQEFSSELNADIVEIRNASDTNKSLIFRNRAE